MEVLLSLIGWMACMQFEAVGPWFLCVLALLGQLTGGMLFYPIVAHTFVTL